MTLPENTLKQRIAPGVWVDAADDLHISIPELLEFFELRDTPTNRSRCVEVVHQVLNAQCPQATIVNRP